MEEKNKRIVLIAIIAACLSLAGIITFATYSGPDRIPEHFSKEMIWVKCANPECNEAYQINKKEYFEYIVENADPLNPAMPPLICKACGEKSVYRAFKCENCGTISFLGSGSGPRDFKDRCPKCKYSNTEQSRKSNR